MKVADLLDSRRQNWRELEQLCVRLESRTGALAIFGRRKKQLEPEAMVQFASLYRTACADLALADAYQLPQHTVAYLHHLVARAHNLLYPARRPNVRKFGEELLYTVPQRLVRDPCFWLAMAIFWGFFFSCLALAWLDRDFPQYVGVTEEMLAGMENMYSDPIGSAGRPSDAGNAMFGFYVQHNTTIGLRCFALGLLFGVGGLFETLDNACKLGAIFGFMARGEYWANFYHFVTAHGPFELTAIVLSAAAGMRLGFSLINTGGYSRVASLRRSGKIVIPSVGLAIVLFALAALIEAFVSPSAPPGWWPAGLSWYWVLKFPLSVFCTLLLTFYFLVLGLSRRPQDATG